MKNMPKSVKSIALASSFIVATIYGANASTCPQSITRANLIELCKDKKTVVRGGGVAVNLLNSQNACGKKLAAAAKAFRTEGKTYSLTQQERKDDKLLCHYKTAVGEKVFELEEKEMSAPERALVAQAELDKS